MNQIPDILIKLPAKLPLPLLIRAQNVIEPQ